MHGFQFIGTMIAFAGSFFAFAYGLYRSFRKKSALYVKIMVFGVGCFMLGRLYELVSILTLGQIQENIHLGNTGTLGMVLFLLAGSRGRVDYLIDDRRSELRKYRVIPVAASVFFGAMTVLSVCFGEKTVSQNAILILTGALMMLTVYYEFKHLIFPDEGLHFVETIRVTNLSSIMINFCSFAMLYFQMTGVDIAYIVFSLGATAGSIVLVISADRGAAEWKH